METTIPNPANIVDIPSSNKFGESLGVMGRQPYPLMMTLMWVLAKNIIFGTKIPFHIPQTFFLNYFQNNFFII